MALGQTPKGMQLSSVELASSHHSQDSQMIDDVLHMWYEQLLSDMKAESPRLQEGNIPTTFISYAWDDGVNEFVRNDLVPDLMQAGVNVIVDFKDLSVGSNLIAHEVKAQTSEYTCVLGTPKFYQKDKEYREDHKVSGVGIEMMFINGRFLMKGQRQRFGDYPAFVKRSSGYIYPSHFKDQSL